MMLNGPQPPPVEEGAFVSRHLPNLPFLVHPLESRKPVDASESVCYVCTSR
jgi:hypothetical protein